MAHASGSNAIASHPDEPAFSPLSHHKLNDMLQSTRRLKPSDLRCERRENSHNEQGDLDEIRGADEKRSKAHLGVRRTSITVGNEVARQIYLFTPIKKPQLSKDTPAYRLPF